MYLLFIFKNVLISLLPFYPVKNNLVITGHGYDSLKFNIDLLSCYSVKNRLMSLISLMLKKEKLICYYC